MLCPTHHLCTGIFRRMCPQRSWCCIQKRYSGGSIPAKSSSKQISIDTPKGNINGQWKHDLHHQLQHDDGPARTRSVYYVNMQIMGDIILQCRCIDVLKSIFW